ncbi:MAG: flagellar biosynthetic protein FliO [Planctomycetes bacterium]|nr:flagellar biosynthetic protein FliO [Planctomycetota bacterium]
MKTIAARTFLTLLLVIVPACIVLATEEPPPGPPDPLDSLFRLAGSMAIVIGLIVAAALATKKLLARARFGTGQDKLLRVHQVLNLGGKRQVFVLDVGTDMLVVGAAGDNMRLLTRLENVPSEATPVDAPEPSDRSSFAQILGAHASDRPAGQASEGDATT